MSDNKELIDLYKQHATGQEKYTYFLLAAAASALAFEIQKTAYEMRESDWSSDVCSSDLRPRI